MTKAVSFVQINMNRSGLAAVELHERLKLLKCEFICLLTEPYRYKGKIANIPAQVNVIPENIIDPRAIIMSNTE